MILSLSRIDMEAEQRDGLTLPLFHDDRNQSQEQDTSSTSFFKTCFNGLNALSGLFVFSFKFSDFSFL